MHDEFQYLTELPGTPKKQSWVQDRLEILSEWERVMLTAVTPPPAPATVGAGFGPPAAPWEGSSFPGPKG